MKTKCNPKAFRLEAIDLKRLKALAKKRRDTQTKVVKVAIECLCRKEGLEL